MNQELWPNNHRESVPPRLILSRKPKEYLRQGLSHCGVYSVKAILSAYGKDDKRSPEEYHTGWFSRNFFISFVIGKKYYENIFRSYGLQVETNSAAHLTDGEKIIFLETVLAANNLVMIRIGNGYATNIYHTILGKLIPHWITLWGYDSTKKVFYIYDSALARKYWDTAIPVGNTVRTFQEILRDWNFGRWQPWCWNTSFKTHLYVRVW